MLQDLERPCLAHLSQLPNPAQPLTKTLRFGQEMPKCHFDSEQLREGTSGGDIALDNAAWTFWP
jgi:hypothetical protein